MTADESEWDAYVAAGTQFEIDKKEYRRFKKNEWGRRCRQNKKLKLATQSTDVQPAVALEQQGSTATFDEQSSIALPQPPISSVATESRAVLRLDASNPLSLPAPSVMPWLQSPKLQAAQQVLPQSPELLLSSTPWQPVPPSPAARSASSSPGHRQPSVGDGDVLSPAGGGRVTSPMAAELADITAETASTQSAHQPEGSSQPSVEAATSPGLAPEQHPHAVALDADADPGAVSVQLVPIKPVVSTVGEGADTAFYRMATVDSDMDSDSDDSDDESPRPLPAPQLSRRGRPPLEAASSPPPPPDRKTRLMAAAERESCCHATRGRSRASPRQTSGPLFESCLPDVGKPIARKSQLHPAANSVLPTALVDELGKTVGRELWNRLVEHPEDAVIMAPMMKVPRPEFFMNTAIKTQWGRCTAPGTAKSKLRLPERLCSFCVRDGDTRLAACPVHGHACTGCTDCFGLCYRCPKCRAHYQIRPVYGTGSGNGSVNPDRARFRVLEFTPGMEEAAAGLDTASPRAPKINSCSMVAYCGKQFCAACALGVRHGRDHQDLPKCPFNGAMKTLKCASCLHFHRDNGNAVNTQSSSVNRTLSLFETRMLQMPLFLARAGGGDNYNSNTLAATFPLSHGSIFHLEPRDELMLPRKLCHGKTVQGSFYHGVVPNKGEDTLPPNGISAALVFRNVVCAREVNMTTDLVIMTHAESLAWEGSGRAEDFKAARERWATQAPVYATKMRPLLEEALSWWRVLPPEVLPSGSVCRSCRSIQQ